MLVDADMLDRETFNIKTANNAVRITNGGRAQGALGIVCLHRLQIQKPQMKIMMTSSVEAVVALSFVCSYIYV